MVAAVGKKTEEFQEIGQDFRLNCLATFESLRHLLSNAQHFQNGFVLVAQDFRCSSHDSSSALSTSNPSSVSGRWL